MYKHLLLFVYAAFYAAIAGAQGIRIMGGTTFNPAQSGQTVVLKDGAHFFNNSALSGNNLVLKFSGADSSFIAGSGGLSVARIEMNKPAGAVVTLKKDLSVTQHISFSDGLLDLNGQNIMLADTAFLTGESETSRITGDSGYVQITRALDAPLAENPGNLGLVITSGSNWGNTIVRRSPRKIEDAGGGGGISRSFEVIPEFNAGLNAFLRMYYLDAELDGLTEADLDFYGADAGASVWDNLGRSGSNTSLNFVNINGIDTIALLTLSTMDVPLPLRLHDLKGTCTAGTVELEWQLEDAQPGAMQHIEHSIDGRSWYEEGAVAAGEQTVYRYTNVNSNGVRFYRIRYSSHGQDELYSRVIEVSCTGADARFELVKNPVRNQLDLKTFFDAGQSVTAGIADMNGRTFIKKTCSLQAGADHLGIDVSGIAAGIYILSIGTSHGLQWQCKFVKE